MYIKSINAPEEFLVPILSIGHVMRGILNTMIMILKELTAAMTEELLIIGKYQIRPFLFCGFNLSI